MTRESDPVFPHASRELAEERKRLAPAQAEAFREFSRKVFADGALSAKTKQIIAVAVAHDAHSILALDTIAHARAEKGTSTA